GAPSALAQATLRVPSEYRTIQGALDAAANGDTVLVAPGTYAGRDANELRFGGKEITLRSESGAANTVLDNGRSGTVLIFDRAEPLGATVEGFTMTGASRSAIQITGAEIGRAAW